MLVSCECKQKEQKDVFLNGWPILEKHDRLTPKIACVRTLFFAGLGFLRYFTKFFVPNRHLQLGDIHGQVHR